MIEKLDIKRNFGFRLSGLQNITSFFSIPFNINVDTLTGSAEWSKSVSQEFEYGFSVPKCVAGTNGNNNVTWTFYQSDVVGISGGYKPIIVVGISDDDIRLIENNRLSLRLELIIDDKNILRPMLPVKLIQLSHQ